MTERVYNKDRAQSLSYENAMERCRNGWVIAREDWLGKAVVFRADSGTFHAKDLITGTMGPFLVVRTQEGKHAPWVPSQADMAAEDWAALTRQTYQRQVVPREGEVLDAHQRDTKVVVQDYAADQRIDP